MTRGLSGVGACDKRWWPPSDDRYQHSAERQRRPRDRQDGPAIILEHGRQGHCDDGHHDARIGRLARADAADHRPLGEPVEAGQGQPVDALPPAEQPGGQKVEKAKDDKLIINIGININIFTPYEDRDRVGRDGKVSYEQLENGRYKQIVLNVQIIAIK